VSKKWQERKEAMEELLNAAKTPKIADRDYSELMSALAKVWLNNFECACR
jgi:cytoskeleton-associated protein 5